MSNEETAKLTEEVSSLKEEMADIAETIQEFLRKQGQNAAHHISDTAEEGWSEAKKKIDVVNKRIHDEPVTSAAIALGIGFLLGLIFGGRSR